jgi:hypothetical protein
MRLGYLTRFRPGTTHYLDIKKQSPFKGVWGSLHFEVAFWFWHIAWMFHLTDWPHPRFLTTVLEGCDAEMA